ncbi:hypothetical protein K439DRAFT_1337122, partial [Ramaria rubella]
LLYDDEISDMEMDLICGVYHIYTGMLKQQCSEDSWWPKHSQWAACGLNMGYWTSSCEVWFQIQLEEICQGKAVLRNGGGWSALKFQRPHSHRLKHSNRHAASAYFDSLPL